MEVSLVGKPESKPIKQCIICGKETDFMVAHKTSCNVDTGCDCDIHVCSSTACEVRGVGRGLFHRTKINPRRNPMNIEIVDDDEEDEKPEVDLVSNPDDDHGPCAECGDPLDEDGACYACDIEPFSNPAKNPKKPYGEFPTEMNVECDECGEMMSGIKTVFTSPTEFDFEFDDEHDPNEATVDFYDFAPLPGPGPRGEDLDRPICGGCYDEVEEEVLNMRKNPAESKIKKYAKTGGLLGAGALIGWFLKDKLD